MSASTRIDLERFVPFRLNRLAAEVSRALARVYGERFGIDIPEWRVIATLGDRGRARAQDIALSTRMHKSMVSRAVARLMELGWVARSASRQRPPRGAASPDRGRPRDLPAAGADRARLPGPPAREPHSSERRMLERLLDKLERAARSALPAGAPRAATRSPPPLLPEPSQR